MVAMNGFRVLIYAPQRACVIGFSDATDFVSASQTARYLRHCGHVAQVLPNTRPLHRQAEEWIATHAPGVTQIACCSCGTFELTLNPLPKPEEPCDGK